MPRVEGLKRDKSIQFNPVRGVEKVEHPKGSTFQPALQPDTHSGHFNPTETRDWSRRKGAIPAREHRRAEKFAWRSRENAAMFQIRILYAESHTRENDG